MLLEGYPVTAITSKAVREDMEATLDRVCDDHERIIITRENGHSVVLMSLEEYEALEETAYLLSSPANAARLMQSIHDIEEGRVTERTLIE